MEARGVTLLWVALAAALAFGLLFGLVVLSDVLTYRDLQRRLRKERERDGGGRPEPSEEVER